MRVAITSLLFGIYWGAACSKIPSTPSTSAAALEQIDMDIEANYHPAYAALATGHLENRQRVLRPWPFALLSIGHTSASYQSYDGNGAYFHHGLDIRGDAGTPVMASQGGEVVNIENYGGSAAYWEIAILDDDGFIWQYHHIDHESIPENVRDAFANHGRIEAGTKLGEIFYWPTVSFGERYHHVHLNILGEGRKYLSPFAFLQPLPDNQSPKFVEVGLLQNGTRVKGTNIRGEYTVYAIIHDLIMHQKFVVPPHSIAYRLDNEPDHIVWNFDTLPGGSSNTKFVNDFFVPSLTCGNYDCRRLAVNLGFSTEGNKNFTKIPGVHHLVITAKDYVGNTTQQDFSWTVE